MQSLGNVLLTLFIGSWCVALGAWVYAARFHYPVSFGRVRDEPRKSEYRTKAWRGGAVFAAAWSLAALVGVIASHFGLWR